MKSKGYLKHVVSMLSLAMIMTACTYEPPDPPPVINQAPVIKGLTDLALPIDFATHEIDFANYVSDQEGEIITYLVSNSNDTVVTISLEGSVLTLTEVGTGPTVINVIATDGHEGHEVEITFTVTVQGIWGAPDLTSGITAGFLDFNGYGEGHIFDYPIPFFTVEGWDYDWESPTPDVQLVNNDHLLITNEIDRQWFWIDYKLDTDYDFTGKKLRFDYSYYIAPDFTGTHWDEDEDPAGIDIRVWYVNTGWSTGGAIWFSELEMDYSTEWQEIKIPLAEFGSLWDMPGDPSKVRYYGLEIWGGTSAAPISFRLDNFGIVD
jgi:hypothetical protein